MEQSKGWSERTLYYFGDDGIVSNEIVLVEFSDGRKPYKFCEWFFNGKTLTYTCYRCRDRLGNYYTKTSVHNDCEWWKKNKTKEKVLCS